MRPAPRLVAPLRLVWVRRAGFCVVSLIGALDRAGLLWPLGADAFAAGRIGLLVARSRPAMVGLRPLVDRFGPVAIVANHPAITYVAKLVLSRAPRQPHEAAIHKMMANLAIHGDYSAANSR